MKDVSSGTAMLVLWLPPTTERGCVEDSSDPTLVVVVVDTGTGPDILILES